MLSQASALGLVCDGMGHRGLVGGAYLLDCHVKAAGVARSYGALSLEPAAWLTAATTAAHAPRRAAPAARRCRATRTCTSRWACCTAWRGTTRRPRTRSAPRSPRARTTTASGTSWARRWPTAAAGARPPRRRPAAGRRVIGLTAGRGRAVGAGPQPGHLARGAWRGTRPAAGRGRALGARLPRGARHCGRLACSLRCSPTPQAPRRRGAAAAKAEHMVQGSAMLSPAPPDLQKSPWG